MTFEILVRRFGRYCLIGACAFAADYSIFLLLLHISTNPYVANVVGICAGITVSFRLNRSHNFHKLDAVTVRFAKFAATALLGMGVSTVAIMLLLRGGIDVRLAKAAAMGLVFVLQFTINALWTFR